MFSKALYYPWIDLRDERWMRTACLFWDELATIVPTSLENPYQNKTANILHKEGFLHPIKINSSSREVKSIAEIAVEYITDPKVKEILNHSGNPIHKDKLPHELSVYLELEIERDYHDTRIHKDKIAKEIKDVVEGTVFKKDNYYYISESFANFYMTLLAGKIADRMGLGIVTDWTTADAFGSTLDRAKLRRRRQYNTIMKREVIMDERHYSPPRRMHKSMVLDIVMQGIMIPEDVSVEKILKFKEKHRDELGRFKYEVNKIDSGGSECDSLESLQNHYLDLMNNHIMPAKRDLSAALNDSQIKNWSGGILKVMTGAPPGLGILIYGLHISTGVALCSVLGASIVGTVIDRAIERRGLRKNPYSYLLRVDEFNRKARDGK